MSFPRFLLVALTIAGLATGAGAESRTWTDRSSRRQVEAEFVALQPGLVWVLRADGEVFSVPLESLSQADQDYVGNLVRQRKREQTARLARDPHALPYGDARRLCELSNPQINESSGLACSRRRPGRFWTHNDSGDDAKLYLFDSKGRDLGSCLLEGVRAYDWEDVCSFQADGKSYLLVGDVGNNGRASGVQMLHLIEEPDVDPGQGLRVRRVPVVRTIYYSYEDDHRNCEALAVDPTDKTILFVAKEPGTRCQAYAMAWPKRPTDPPTALTARVIATLAIPSATAMDVSPDGRRAVVLTYANAYEYTRRPNEDWGKAFSRPPREIAMPVREQGESICYGPDGKTLYLTSEKLPTPLWEVRAADSSTGVLTGGDGPR